MTTLTLQLPPALTPTIQLYARIGGAAVGSPITLVEGSASIYTCTVPTGDYNVSLSGVSTPNALPFPMRDGIAYPGIPWTIIDATITTPPTYPAIVAGLCSVLVTAMLNGDAVSGVIVTATLEGWNNAVDSAIASRAVDTATTDGSGNCFLELVKYSEFTSGGIYRIIAKHGRIVIWDVRVKIPDADTCNLEDLPNDTTGRG